MYNLLTITDRNTFAGLSVLVLITFSSLIPSIIAFDGHALTPLQSATTWEIVEHSYFHDDTNFRDIAFVNSTHGWVVGQNQTGLYGGIILHTKDGGNSWNLQHYNYSQRFRTISIIDHQTLWVSGARGLVYTTDGGLTWNWTQIVDINAGLGAVQFVNATHGWTSTLNEIFETVDGGQTWQNITSWNYEDSLRMIQFVSPSEAWGIGFSGIYHTADTCATWERKHSQGGWALTIVSESEGWAVADDLLLHMTDGETWVEQPQPRKTHSPLFPTPYFTDILFLDEAHGWIVGLEMPVAFTPNGGLSWYAQSVPETMDRRMNAIDFVNLTHGCAVGSGGYILLTSHGSDLGSLLLTEGTYTNFFSIGTILLVLLGGVILWYRHRRNIHDAPLPE